MYNIPYIRNRHRDDQWQAYEASCLYHAHDHSLVKYLLAKDFFNYNHNKYNVKIIFFI